MVISLSEHKFLLMYLSDAFHCDVCVEGLGQQVCETGVLKVASGLDREYLVDLGLCGCVLVSACMVALEDLIVLKILSVAVGLPMLVSLPNVLV